MTAPAEDPRGGECQQSDWCGPGSHCLCRRAGDRAQPTHELRGIHTACDKWIRVERGEYGTKIHLTEPERGIGTAEHTMWANLSPRAVHELVAALESATPRLDDLLAAEAAVSRVEAVMAAWNRGEPVGGYLPREIRRALDGAT